ncbi:MAG: DUF1566 domain-containing protein [Deltaproteobacteria bacterium]|nr:DUF1566 domain-containing protein [Deltaproteobacteria bacterium]
MKMRSLCLLGVVAAALAGCWDPMSERTDSETDTETTTVDFETDSNSDSDSIPPASCAGCYIGGVCIADGALNSLNSCQKCDVAVVKTDWVNITGCGSECSGCLIGGVCHAAGQSSDDPCWVCDIGANATGWSPLPGALCDDGNPCTDWDECNNLGQCVGVAKDCNDHIDCTADMCVQGRCTNDVLPSLCKIDGKCFADGDINAANDCEACSSAANNAGWTAREFNAPCNDGKWCNGADSCDGMGTCSVHEFVNGNRCDQTDGCNTTVCNEIADNCFASSQTVCQSEQQYRCASTECGGQIERYVSSQYCSGTSSMCDGRVSDTGWTVSKTCLSHQACNDSLGEMAVCASTFKCGCESEGNFYDAESDLCFENPASVETMTYEEASEYCAEKSGDYSLGGHWDMPNVVELQSLIRGCVNGEAKDGDSICRMLPEDCEKSGSCSGCELATCASCTDGEGPDDAPAGCYWPMVLSGECNHYWSSTSVREPADTEASNMHFYVFFNGGVVSYPWVTVDAYVRCVRRRALLQ